MTCGFIGVYVWDYSLPKYVVPRVPSLYAKLTVTWLKLHVCNV